MKKKFGFLIFCFLFVSLTACGGGGGSDKKYHVPDDSTSSESSEPSNPAEPAEPAEPTLDEYQFDLVLELKEAERLIVSFENKFWDVDVSYQERIVFEGFKLQDGKYPLTFNVKFTDGTWLSSVSGLSKEKLEKVNISIEESLEDVFYLDSGKISWVANEAGDGGNAIVDVNVSKDGFEFEKSEVPEFEGGDEVRIDENVSFQIQFKFYQADFILYTMNYGYWEKVLTSESSLTSDTFVLGPGVYPLVFNLRFQDNAWLADTTSINQTKLSEIEVSLISEDQVYEIPKENLIWVPNINGDGGNISIDVVVNANYEIEL